MAGFTAHHTHMTVHTAFMGGVSCVECGLDPATIVAAEVIASVASPSSPPTTRRPDVMRIKEAIAHHERCLETLRRHLSV